MEVLDRLYCTFASRFHPQEAWINQTLSRQASLPRRWRSLPAPLTSLVFHDIGAAYKSSSHFAHCPGWLPMDFDPQIFLLLYQVEGFICTNIPLNLEAVEPNNHRIAPRSLLRLLSPAAIKISRRTSNPDPYQWPCRAPEAPRYATFSG